MLQWWMAELFYVAVVDGRGVLHSIDDWAFCVVILVKLQLLLFFNFIPFTQKSSTSSSSRKLKQIAYLYRPKVWLEQVIMQPTGERFTTYNKANYSLKRTTAGGSP